MNSLKAASANEVQVRLCEMLARSGSEVDPRGMPTRELLNISFEICDPRNRLTTLAVRKWSGALAVAELAWHLRGEMDVTPLEFYAPRWRDFADDGGLVRGSCYGARIFGSDLGRASQWQNVKALLKQDPSSRRAVLNFRAASEDVSETSKDISCTNSMQFILRERKLHAFVNMRSNDVIWGVPYDIFLFTLLQELMAAELEVELGSYFHSAASMHVYDRHFGLCDLIGSQSNFDLGRMPSISRPDEVFMLAAAERQCRVSKVYSADGLGEFGNFCMDILMQHKAFSAAA